MCRSFLYLCAAYAGLAPTREEILFYTLSNLFPVIWKKMKETYLLWCKAKHIPNHSAGLSCLYYALQNTSPSQNTVCLRQLTDFQEAKKSIWNAVFLYLCIVNPLHLHLGVALPTYRTLCSWNQGWVTMVTVLRLLTSLLRCLYKEGFYSLIWCLKDVQLHTYKGSLWLKWMLTWCL